MALWKTNLVGHDLKSLPIEEELVRLLKFLPLERIVEFINSKIELDLHYPTQKLETPLTATIDRGLPSILQVLLDKYPVSLDSTRTQPFGKTALMHASYVVRNVDVLRVLIARGANVNKTDMRGWSCLFYAIIGEKIENVKYLLESDADMESRDLRGRTPLMNAVILSNLKITKLLLERGANTGAIDNLGNCSLRLAILNKKQEQAILLVENGSNVNRVPSTSTYSNYDLAKYLMPDLLLIMQRKKKNEKKLIHNLNEPLIQLER